MHHVLEAPDEHVHPHEHHPEHGEPGAGDEELGHGEVGAARGGERVALVVVEAGESGAPDRRHVVLEGAREGDGVMIRQTREALHVFRRWTCGEVRGPVDHVAVEVEAREGGCRIELEEIHAGGGERAGRSVHAVRAARWARTRAG